jgi:hypothetical protein
MPFIESSGDEGGSYSFSSKISGSPALKMVATLEQVIEAWGADAAVAAKVGPPARKSHMWCR